MILEPPSQYLAPYATLTEWILDAPEVDWLCRTAGVKSASQVIGCSFKIGDRCYIILSSHAVDVLRRHETAHCNGWRH